MRNLFIAFLFLVRGLYPLQEAYSQEQISFDSLVAGHVQEPNKFQYFAYYRSCTNEVQFILASLFVGYKTIFSSQDLRHCTFNPSCSVYAVQSMKKKGVIIGFMDTMDRLTRCNGLSPQNYEYDAEHKLLMDPP